jgi:hypothetical protein
VVRQTCERGGTRSTDTLKPAMTRGPYAPPSARVADRAIENIPRPRQVTIAVALLWVSLVLGLPTWVLSASRDPETAFHPAFIVFMAIVFLLSAALNILIHRGRNWARILLLVLVVIAGALLLVPVDEPVPAGVLENTLTAVSLALDAVALYLLFTPPGASWYRRPAV